VTGSITFDPSNPSAGVRVLGHSIAEIQQMKQIVAMGGTSGPTLVKLRASVWELRRELLLRARTARALSAHYRITGVSESEAWNDGGAFALREAARELRGLLR
jgi:hypothetical protein